MEWCLGASCRGQGQGFVVNLTFQSSIAMQPRHFINGLFAYLTSVPLLGLLRGEVADDTCHSGRGGEATDERLRLRDRDRGRMEDCKTQADGAAGCNPERGPGTWSN